MSKMIQIRNVPDDVHRALKAKAAHAGMSLSDFLLREIRHVAEQPTIDEFLARIRSRPARAKYFDSAKAVRAERSSR